MNKLRRYPKKLFWAIYLVSLVLSLILQPLLLRADGDLVRLRSTGTLLGMFESWGGSLDEVTLAAGDTTKNAARKHRVSAGRISQIRRELKNNWEAFQGEGQSPLATLA